MTKILLLFLLLLIPLAEAQADDVLKRAYLTCDENSNTALIRLTVDYSDSPVIVNLPAKYQKYQYLNGQEFTQSCLFSDGRKIAIATNVGESHPGQWDAPAGFSLSINNKYIFYKKDWYATDGNIRGINPLVVILNDKKLVSCKGPADSGSERIEDFKIKDGDCVDLSERLESGLPAGELGNYAGDKRKDSYKEVVANSHICSLPLVENREIWRSVFHKVQFKDTGLKFGRSEKGVHGYFGSLRHAVYDINNDGLKETVYEVAGESRKFYGNFFFYFSDTNHEKDFMRCSEKGICPKSILKAFEILQPNELKTAMVGVWPSMSILYAENTGFKGSEFNGFVHPVIIDNKSYIYSETTDANAVPRVALSEIENNSAKIICTYKDRPKW